MLRNGNGQGERASRINCAMLPLTPGPYTSAARSEAQSAFCLSSFCREFGSPIIAFAVFRFQERWPVTSGAGIPPAKVP